MIIHGKKKLMRKAKGPGRKSINKIFKFTVSIRIHFRIFRMNMGKLQEIREIFELLAFLRDIVGIEDA